MKNLGPYRKYIVAAAVVQSVIVIFASYLLFKAKKDAGAPEDSQLETPVVEAQVTNQ